ncbi:MAG TPA: hypothetical protein VFB07_03110 [Vicinamibacterales bacterium]|nr:hypothetical protein [Vicinamibacterales bacterium]
MDTTTRECWVLTFLRLARVGYAQWLFGNAYEAVVRVPERLAAEPLPSVFSSGSPVRYYLPAMPLVAGATVAALVSGWSLRDRRPWLAATAAGALSAAVATAYAVRAVNLKLFVAGGDGAVADRDRLLRRWHRVNAVRMAAVGFAWLAAARAASGMCVGAGAQASR